MSRDNSNNSVLWINSERISFQGKEYVLYKLPDSGYCQKCCRMVPSKFARIPTSQDQREKELRN